MSGYRGYGCILYVEYRRDKGRREKEWKAGVGDRNGGFLIRWRIFDV